VHQAILQPDHSTFFESKLLSFHQYQGNTIQLSELAIHYAIHLAENLNQL